MYVIRRNDGNFVADMRKTRTGGSYTPALQCARVYGTKEAAEGDLCPEKERVVSIQSIIEG